MSATDPVALLECRNLGVSVPGRELLRGLETVIRPGTMVPITSASDAR